MFWDTYKQVISEAFDSKQWNYSSKSVTANNSEEREIFSIDFVSDEYGEIDCRIHIYESGVCDIQAFLPVVCPKDKLAELSLYFAKQNYARRYATLRLDASTGMVTNDYSFMFNQATTSSYFLKSFLDVKDVANDVMEEIFSICGKSIGQKEAELSQSATDTQTKKVHFEKRDKHKLEL